VRFTNSAASLSVIVYHQRIFLDISAILSNV
jgi:hypothetical protein